MRWTLFPLSCYTWQVSQLEFSNSDEFWVFLRLCAFWGIDHFFLLAEFSLFLRVDLIMSSKLLICIFSCLNQSHFSQQLWCYRRFTRWILLWHNLPTRRGINQHRWYFYSRWVIWLWRVLLLHVVWLFWSVVDSIWAWCFKSKKLYWDKESIRYINEFKIELFCH